MANPWERLPGEPAKWFSRFEVFRLLGPERTMEATWRSIRTQQGKAQSNTRPTQPWFDTSRKWKWGERAAAWDAVEFERIEKRDRKLRDQARDVRRIGLLNAATQIVNELKARNLETVSTQSLLGILVDFAEALRDEFGDSPAHKHEVSGPGGKPLMPVPEVPQETIEAIVERLSRKVKRER